MTEPAAPSLRAGIEQVRAVRARLATTSWCEQCKVPKHLDDGTARQIMVTAGHELDIAVATLEAALKLLADETGDERELPR